MTTATTTTTTTMEALLDMLGRGPRLDVALSQYHDGQIVTPAVLARRAGRGRARVVLSWWDASDRAYYGAECVEDTIASAERWLERRGVRLDAQGIYFSTIRASLNDLMAAGLARQDSALLIREYDSETIGNLLPGLEEIRTAEGDGPYLPILDLARALLRDDSPGEALWSMGLRDDERYHQITGWPRCSCTACGCDEPATTTDDAPVPVCEECSEYTCDADGDVVCSRCSGVETVYDGGHAITRLTPPAEPTPDPNGEWACYWNTVGNDARVVARYATRQKAEQAVAAKDWPGPTDHTNYLCGYEVRRLDHGRWVSDDEARAEYDV